MGQKYIVVNSLKLAYLEENSSSEKIIFFIHGNSLSAASWKNQLNSNLLKNYRLIAIELPAHGDSDASANPAQDYSVIGLGNIMAAAIKMLAGNSPYLLAGLSLGTNILVESLAFNLQPHGIVLASSCIVGENYAMADFALPGTNVYVVFTEQSAHDEVNKYASQVMTNQENVEEFISDYYRVKLPFRSALMTSIQQQEHSDEIKLLQSSKKPVFIVFGKDEQIVNPDYLDNAPISLWRDSIFKVSGAGHLVQQDQPEEFNRLLSAYAEDMMQKYFAASE